MKFRVKLRTSKAWAQGGIPQSSTQSKRKMRAVRLEPQPGGSICRAPRAEITLSGVPVWPDRGMYGTCHAPDCVDLSTSSDPPLPNRSAPSRKDLPLRCAKWRRQSPSAASSHPPAPSHSHSHLPPATFGNHQLNCFPAPLPLPICATATAPAPHQIHTTSTKPNPRPSPAEHTTVNNNNSNH